MSDFNFHEFNRQNILGVVVIFSQSVRRMFNAYLAFFATTLFTDGIGRYAWTFFGLSVVFMVVTSILRYKNFQFKVSDKQLILNSGILTKEVTNIPLERIQSVQLHQNFVQRILRITGLKIDTAGSVTQELEISALTKTKAKAMLKELRKEQSELVDLKPEEGEEEIAVTEIKEQIEEPQVKLVDLDFKALLMLAITENHIRNGLIAIAFISGYAGQYLDYSEEFLINAFDDYAPELIESTLTQVVVFIFFFLILSVFLSFVQVILKFYDFRASVGHNSFEIKAGLIKRNEFTVPLNKIQFLEWQTNIVRKSVGFESIKIHQGRSVESVGKNQLEIPACYADQTNLVMETLFPEVEKDDEFYLNQPHPYQKVFRSIVLGLLGIPFLVILMFSTELYVWSLVAYVVYLGLVIISAVKYYQSMNLWVNEEVLIYERGWIFPKRTVVKLFKLQSVDINQSIFQKRRGICHLSFSTAAGRKSFRFFDEKEMSELRDFLLFKTESYTGKWM